MPRPLALDSDIAPGYQRRQSVELGRTKGLPALLEVKDLHTEFRTGAGLVRRAPERVRGVVFSGTPSGATSLEVRRLQQEYAATLPPGPVNEPCRPSLRPRRWPRRG